MNALKILLVHSDPSALSLLGSMLQTLGHGIEECSNDSAAARLIERGGVGLLVAGVNPSDPDGLELLSYVRRKHPQIPVVLLFSQQHPERTREAVRLGATAIMRYPLPATEFRAGVTQALEGVDMRARAQSPAPAPVPAVTRPSLPGSHAPRMISDRFVSSEPASFAGVGLNSALSVGSVPSASPAQSHSQAPAPAHSAGSPSPFGTRGQSESDPWHQAEDFPPLLGDSPALRQTIEVAATVAAARTSVLITGDPGAGKTTLARLIHRQSPRADRPFVEVMCGGIDEAHLELELFGRRVSAPDGMVDRPGKLQKADGGTLCLDEAASLSMNLQRQLLRVLQDGEFDPLGSNQSIRVDVRLILATQHNLAALVEQGTFRRDLYDRVSVVCLKLPALKHRGLDVEELAEFFRDRYSREFGKSVVGFSPDAMELLRRHDWPGNVRELESVVQRGVALCQNSRITTANLAINSLAPRISPANGYSPRPHLPLGIRPLKEALEEPEKQIIIQALQALNWNRQETARLLDINRTTLYKKMKKYGLLEDPAGIS